MDQKQVANVLAEAERSWNTSHAPSPDGDFCLYDYLLIQCLSELLDAVKPIVNSIDAAFLNANPLVPKMLQWPIEDVAENPKWDIHKLHKILAGVIKTRDTLQDFPEQFQKAFQAFAKKFKEMYPNGRRVRYQRYNFFF